MPTHSEEPNDIKLPSAADRRLYTINQWCILPFLLICLLGTLLAGICLIENTLKKSQANTEQQK
jgi:hypothetical protein